MRTKKAAQQQEGPLFRELDERPKLQIVQASFVAQQEASFPELIAGYDSLRVLTYSNSVAIINHAAAALADIEIVFGREDILNGMAQYLHYQEFLLRDLITERTAHVHIRQKIESGALRLYVVQEMISHEKLFLLEGSAGHRVITGSANFSDAAFTGTQNESYLCFDNDPGAWDYFCAKYEHIRQRSATSIAKTAVLDDVIDIEKLPALSAGRPGGEVPKIIIVSDRSPAPTPVQKALSQKTPKHYTGLSSVLTTEHGVVRLDRGTTSRVVQYVRSNSRTETENTEEYLSIYRERSEVVLSGQPYALVPPPAAVQADVDGLTEYFKGFTQFRGGDPARLARDYFTFMSWLYVGPFICDFRNRALARDEYLMDYPIFGVLYGKSNCGKSELIRTLLVSMFGREGFLPNDWLTKSNIPGLREQNRRYPMVFDDLDRTRFDNHVNALIKDDSVQLREYPITVLSMNAEKDTFETEIRKRSLIIYTGASLPDHTGESRKLASQIKKIKRALGTALYREYLRRVLEQLQDEPPTDILAFSSTILVEIFAEHRQGALPAWCRTVSMNDYVQAKHDKVKDELGQLYRHKPSAWSIQAGKVILKLDDIVSARKLRKDIPDYLINPGSQGDVIIFTQADLETFLDTPLLQPGEPMSMWQHMLLRWKRSR
ncbi:hypothetical protein [Candidatus Chloroploca asiatica]|uniref:PLD phosphodiesterase domain-containing protein n=1 Tax=Candidatus Chloroploca asiatica TaxID=1506545 RepID=A0A2H3KQD2_9CHLR|nr:hypothetical protein [Candidatus Chloroploca asiatica]PDW00584.1 hypothetical protein A9Q02_09345 [Candidatus Chloroploca asiatica]